MAGGGLIGAPGRFDVRDGRSYARLYPVNPNQIQSVARGEGLAVRPELQHLLERAAIASHGVRGLGASGLQLTGRLTQLAGGSLGVPGSCPGHG